MRGVRRLACTVLESHFYGSWPPPKAAFANNRDDKNASIEAFFI